MWMMIEVEADEENNTFRVTSLSDAEDSMRDAHAANRDTDDIGAIAHLLANGWEPYACMHVRGSTYPIRHYFRKRACWAATPPRADQDGLSGQQPG